MQQPQDSVAQQPKDRANIVSGRVTLKESGAGIPDLVVSAFAVDAGSKGDNLSDHLQAGRLGTVVTGPDGQFELHWEDGDGNGHDGRRPGLLLAVLAPDERGATLESRLLYASPEARNAGRVEQYIVRLTAEQLEAAGVEAPSTDTDAAEPPDAVLARLTESEAANAKLTAGFRDLKSLRVERRRALGSKFEREIKPKLVAALSNVHPDLVGSPGFVQPGKDPAAASLDRIRHGLETVINAPADPKVRAPMTGVIHLSDEQLKDLRDRGFANPDGDLVDVPADLVEPLLFGPAGERDRKTVLVATDPLARLCRDETDGDKCLQDKAGDGGGGVETIAAENDGGGLDIAAAENDGEPPLEDSSVYVARLLDGLSAPDLPAGAEPPSRPDQDAVQKQVDALLLRGGPADVPAFYDFHNLQIAFEHVWQEALDTGALDLAEDAYSQIVELGGDPCKDAFEAVPGAPIHIIRCFQREATRVTQALLEEPEFVVVQAFEVTREQWSVLNHDLRLQLRLAARHVTSAWKYRETANQVRNRFLRRGELILRYADTLLGDAPERPFDHLHRILAELEERILEPYAFTVYGATPQRRSVNFGILLTYRQRWEPTTYQTGELVRTVTLTPKESRKFSRKVVTKHSRARKEADSSVFSRREETSTTSRAEAEIVRNALAKTNFNLTAEGTYNVAVYGGKVSTTFGGEASNTSNEVKKDFREAVFKAAQEYRDEHKLEVSTEETVEEEFVESGEIVNPNDELSVTYLFYELQRRYKVSERLHRIRPVVLVAQEVPAPDEIDDEWLIAYGWILRRFLLDDSFIPALNYLATNVVGDEHALRELRRNVDQQRRLVDELKEEVVAYREQVGQRYAALERAIERSAQAAEEDSDGGLFGAITTAVAPVARMVEKGLDALSGGDEDPEAVRIRERAARDAYEKATQDERDWLARMNREVTALNAITDAYTKSLSDHLNRRTQISRLRIHIKQNILYYMQAIWLMEPDDQRFFRLHKVQVPVFENTAKRYTIQGKPTFRRPVGDLLVNGKRLHRFGVDAQIDPQFNTAPLDEVADLDNLIGFKGNYMLFPLKRSNALTDFMLAPYRDQAWELYDPDEAGAMNLEEFSRYVCCLKDTLPAEEFEAAKPELKELMAELLTSPLRDNEEIVVPTDSLYLEALPGTFPLLEDFKLLHRAMDVRKVQAELRGQELDNVRAAARIVAGELDDPDIESVKQVFVRGVNVEPDIDVGDDN